MSASRNALRVALCQLNATVGDIDGNAELVLAGIEAARQSGAALAVFPELALTGYPPEDLLLREHFLRDARRALDRVASETKGIAAIIGFPEHAEVAYNAAAVLCDGTLVGIHRKVHLPNYGVFDEERYFESGSRGTVFDLGPTRIGVTVCEDVWMVGSPVADESLAGAALIVNISASPYHAGKGAEREQMFAERARENGCAFAFCGLVGGQDELVFDGHSFVVDASGAVVARATQFCEELLLCELELGAQRDGPPAAGADAAPTGEPERPVAMLGQLEAAPATGPVPASRIAELLDPVEAEIYAALCCGVHDYVVKNGFSDVVLGLSGGIDSALVACIAADALGPDRVAIAVLPSPYSAADSQSDARELAANLGVRAIELPIEGVMHAYEELLAATFTDHAPDVTEENLQARIRGNLLMALSNKCGWLVLTTGNKSEQSVGYSTLYGDAAGGFAVIKDIDKGMVYRLARHRNTSDDAPIPESILDRAPSAELRPDQRDDDSLPPYPLLDEILRAYVEQDTSRETLIERGYAEDVVDRVIALVDGAEYKRRQAPPGIKVTERAFGRDRRMPLTNRYRDR